MLVVVSAGNDGDKEWKVVSAPADAQGALTVGSTKYDHWSKATFSSIGPNQLPYIKPEIVCFANAGTSFSAPIITGLAAVILAKNPSLTQYQLKSIIMRSGHLYPYGNNFVGYGVPKASNILGILSGDSTISAQELKSHKNRITLPIKGKKHAVLYHKYDEFRVMREDYLELKKGKIKIDRFDNVLFTTVIVDNNQVFEIRWMQAN
jgi:subtilisin family serine protease